MKKLKATKTYSEKIKDLLQNFGEENKKSILNVRRELGILLSHVSNMNVIPQYYRPELYYKRRKDRRLITFQVFDKQCIKEDRGDIFSALFSDNIVFAYFIVNNLKRLNSVNELISIIESKLINDFNADRKMFPICKGILVKEKELKNKGIGFIKIIGELCVKDKW